MKKFGLILTLILALFATAAQAETILNPDSIVVGEDQLLEIKFLEVTGPTDDDTFPDAKWCTDHGSNPANCKPDGWVTKEDSPYYRVDVADLGQRDLYDAMRAGAITRYPGYKDGDWYGKTWAQLSNYTKMLQHMTDQTTKQQVGWRVLIRFTTEQTSQAHYDWSQIISQTGFGDPSAVLFLDHKIEVNTKYMFGHPNAGSVYVVSANPPQIWLDLFIPRSSTDIYDKLLADLEAWNQEPILVSQVIDGVTTYIRQ